MTLQGEVAIITGATLGIGKAIAYKLARHGVHLLLTARTASNLEVLANEIRDTYSDTRVEWIAADVTDSTQVDALIAHALKTFGQIDILVNNVGRGLRKPITETSDEEWYAQIDQNLSGTFFACRAVIAHMRSHSQGLIINIASRAGRTGEAEMTAYSAVKFGVIGLTRALAAEVKGTGIRINAISPGPVSTERMKGLRPDLPPDQWLSPEDVAEAVLFIATSPGHTMQGQSLDMF